MRENHLYIMSMVCKNIYSPMDLAQLMWDIKGRKSSFMQMVLGVGKWWKWKRRSQIVGNGIYLIISNLYNHLDDLMESCWLWEERTHININIFCGHYHIISYFSLQVCSFSSSTQMVYLHKQNGKLTKLLEHYNIRFNSNQTKVSS